MASTAPATAVGLPLHYDLHAYIWKANPDGVFHTDNRKVTC